MQFKTKLGLVDIPNSEVLEAAGIIHPERAHEEIKFFIYSLEHSGWWKPNQHGYCSARGDAGRYTWKEALDILAVANFDRPDFPDGTLVPALPIEQSKTGCASCGGVMHWAVPKEFAANGLKIWVHETTGLLRCGPA